MSLSGKDRKKHSEMGLTRQIQLREVIKNEKKICRNDWSQSPKGLIIEEHLMIFLGYFSPALIKTYVVATHLKRLGEALLMSTHNIRFMAKLEMTKITQKYYQILLLMKSSGYVFTHIHRGCRHTHLLQIYQNINVHKVDHTKPINYSVCVGRLTFASGDSALYCQAAL